MNSSEEGYQLRRTFKSKNLKYAIRELRTKELVQLQTKKAKRAILGYLHNFKALGEEIKKRYYKPRNLKNPRSYYAIAIL